MGSRSGSQNPISPPLPPPKSAAEVGDTEAVSKRGRIVFIWAEIKLEQLPRGGLESPRERAPKAVLPFVACPSLPALPGLAFVFVCFQRRGGGGG